MAVSDTFRRVVRSVVGLPKDPGAPPDLIRLGLYPARVDKCASDGSTIDVTPADARISPEKNVKVRVGIPGATAQVVPGCVVLLGWERGDPGKPYCVPVWDIGATVLKLILNAQAIHLASESGSDPIVTKADIDAIKLAIAGAAVVAQDGGAALKANILAAWPVLVGSQKANAAR